MGISTSASYKIGPMGKTGAGTGHQRPRAVSRANNKPLRGPNQEEITTVTDFLIDPQSGQLLFAVAGSGRGAAGETFRLIPIEALDTSRATEGFTLHLSRSQWDQVGTLTDQELKGRIAINPEHQQRLTRQFSLRGAAANTGTTEVIRAGDLARTARRCPPQ
ncbi:MAG: PRC-barrel domain-containing protein [Opitutaceae bacterium]|nr:PRC-barrel domain-containing protein [Opitutaceae bacterium]